MRRRGTLSSAAADRAGLRDASAAPSRSSGRFAAPSSILRARAVKGAAVLITDEATEHASKPSTPTPRADTRRPNLKPGTVPGRGHDAQLQEVRADQRARPRGRHRAGGRHARSRRRQRDHDGLGRSGNNITLDSQAISRGLDEQQLHDLPRNSRDIQSFLLLNPNVVGGTRRHAVPRRQDLRRVVHPGRPGLDQRDLRHRRQLGAGPRRHLGDAGAVELVQRRIRRPGGRRRHDQARQPAVSRHRLLRLQQQRPERADLQPDARLASSGTIRCPTRTSIGGAAASAVRCSATSCSSTATTKARTTRPSTAAADRPRFRPRPCAPATSAAPRFTRRDPLTGEPFPDQVIPADRIDPSATKIMNFFYPLPNQGNRGERLRRLPAVRAGDAQAAAGRHPARLGGDEERLVVLPRAAISTAIRATSRSRRATC